eukprot:2679248-Alexandrium_andersonii.AAC.1
MSCAHDGGATQTIALKSGPCWRRHWSWRRLSGTHHSSAHPANDVWSAFDNASPRKCAKALETWGIHPQLIAALLTESAGLRAVASYAGVQVTFTFTKCIRQGNVDSSLLFQ